MVREEKRRDKGRSREEKRREKKKGEVEKRREEKKRERRKRRGKRFNILFFLGADHAVRCRLQNWKDPSFLTG